MITMRGKGAAIAIAWLMLLVAWPGSGHAQQSTNDEPAAGRLVAAAIDRTRQHVTYDGSYHRIPYPMGDVPADIGVCTDVIIRAYRAGLGIDLQKEVHEDMKAAFGKYPKIWGLSRPDTNIDHRRVPNLEAFFTRHGQPLPITDDPADYKPGDLVTWRLTGTGLPHIGIVTDRRAMFSGNPLIAHNIGRGPQLDDMLFDYSISGHFRYLPKG